MRTIISALAAMLLLFSSGATNAYQYQYPRTFVRIDDGQVFFLYDGHEGCEKLRKGVIEMDGKPYFACWEIVNEKTLVIRVSKTTIEIDQSKIEVEWVTMDDITPLPPHDDFEVTAS